MPQDSEKFPAAEVFISWIKTIIFLAAEKTVGAVLPRL